MNHAIRTVAQTQKSAAIRFVLLMIGIFACGCIVGGAATRAVSRYQWRMAMKNPESLAARISPQLVSSVGLRSEQLGRVEYLINKRYERIEALRAETYPFQLAEFDKLCSEIEDELDGTQRTRWLRLVEKLKSDYLPVPHDAAPTADFLFTNFDANNDGILESTELPPPMWMRVQTADTDGNGTVSRSEFESVRNRIAPQ